MGSQARPVRQKKICQCKYHIQLCRLLWQTSVSCLSISEPILNYSENILNFCSDRGLLAFPAPNLCL